MLPDLKSGKLKPLALGFKDEAEAKHEAGAEAHRSHDERLLKAKSERKARSITRPKHFRNHVPKWVLATRVKPCNRWVENEFTTPNGQRL